MAGDEVGAPLHVDRHLVLALHLLQFVAFDVEQVVGNLERDFPLDPADLPFGDAGLHLAQEGDRLTAVNGTELRSVGQAYALMGALQNQNSINITVIRDGVPVLLHYNLH